MKRISDGELLKWMLEEQVVIVRFTCRRHSFYAALMPMGGPTHLSFVTGSYGRTRKESALKAMKLVGGGPSLMCFEHIHDQTVLVPVGWRR